MNYQLRRLPYLVNDFSLRLLQWLDIASSTYLLHVYFLDTTGGSSAISKAELLLESYPTLEMPTRADFYNFRRLDFTQRG